MSKSLFAHGHEAVNADLVARFSVAAAELFAEARAEPHPRLLEEGVWQLVLDLSRRLMSAGLALMCRDVAEKDIAERGLEPDDVRLRLDTDYHMTMKTTFGHVSFPAFAYRDRSSGAAEVTRVPSREVVFPLLHRCRSSELCLEWEAKLGSEHPFRQAQKALSYFTHGAVETEDTTIASHMVTVGQLVDRSWLYRPADEIRGILRTRATIDAETGRPIVYLSTDAHALRRYVDETWDAKWKMTNGIRVWCVDRRTRAVIHLGGEYTWGDCHHVRGTVAELIASGHLPVDGDYGDGVVATIAIVTDGMPWIEDHVVSLFEAPLPILDAYHALEHLSAYVSARFGKGTPKARAMYDGMLRTLLGEKAPGKRRRKKRKGRRKRSKNRSPYPEAVPSVPSELPGDREPAPKILLDLLSASKVPGKHAEAHGGLVAYVEHNAYRMDYPLYRSRGFQIGSGAMESLHRVATQPRLKIPCPGWLRETSEAIFNLRMMALADRWEEFWTRPGLTTLLCDAFSGSCRPIHESDAEAA